ncbi:hypothetical protein FKM82_030674 [Ascaphus truei]
MTLSAIIIFCFEDRAAPVICKYFVLSYENGNISGIQQIVSFYSRGFKKNKKNLCSRVIFRWFFFSIFFFPSV